MNIILRAFFVCLFRSFFCSIFLFSYFLVFMNCCLLYMLSFQTPLKTLNFITIYVAKSKGKCNILLLTTNKAKCA